jgi:ABC-type glycerol-3-phosphate transport system permease component
MTPTAGKGAEAMYGRLNFFKVFEAVRHYTVLVIVSLIVVFPFLWMLSMSLMPPEEILSHNLIPSRLDFSNYAVVWQTLPLLRYLMNSTYIAVLTTLFCLVLAVPAGYSMSLYHTKVARGGMLLFIFSQLIPSVLPFISYYFIMFNFGLTNSYTGLIMTYAIWGIPFCILMMRGYFATAIPVSLYESATVDGCSKYGVFFKIALPLAVPGLASVAIFSFILAWNEFMFASVMLTNNDLKPVSVGIFDFVGQFGAAASLPVMMATAVIVAFPAMVLFGFLQRYLVSGLGAGAVKG